MTALAWRHGLCGWLLMCLSCWAFAVGVTDDRGVTVSFERSPQRVISLLPSLTETVCALDRCERLVGVDRYSDFPAKVQRLPQLGGGLDPNIEAVVALRPDVVLIAKSSRVADRLQALGLKVLALEPKTQADAQRVLLTLGQVLDVPDAPNVWRAIDEGVSSAARTLPEAARSLRVYFEVNDGPYAAGETSFIGEILVRLRVKNVVPAELGAFPKLNPEFVVQANPDLIMVGERSASSLSQRPGWNRIRAIREKRLCVFTSAQANVLVRPGPRMAEAAHLMADCFAAHLPAPAGQKR